VQAATPKDTTPFRTFKMRTEEPHTFNGTSWGRCPVRYSPHQVRLARAYLHELCFLVLRIIHVGKRMQPLRILPYVYHSATLIKLLSRKASRWIYAAALPLGVWWQLN
ncbi:hypothetical protein FRC09_011693, partial [Ceratobasidium sp. 395]